MKAKNFLIKKLGFLLVLLGTGILPSFCASFVDGFYDGYYGNYNSESRSNIEIQTLQNPES